MRSGHFYIFVSLLGSVKISLHRRARNVKSWTVFWSNSCIWLSFHLPWKKIKRSPRQNEWPSDSGRRRKHSNTNYSTCLCIIYQLLLFLSRFSHFKAAWFLLLPLWISFCALLPQLLPGLRWQLSLPPLTRFHESLFYSKFLYPIFEWWCAKRCLNKSFCNLRIGLCVNGVICVLQDLLNPICISNSHLFSHPSRI